MDLILLKTKNDMDIIAEHIETRKGRIEIKNPVSFFHMANGMLGMKYMLLHSDADSVIVDSDSFLFISDSVKREISDYYSQFIHHYKSVSSESLTLTQSDSTDSQYFDSDSLESYPSKLLH